MGDINYNTYQLDCLNFLTKLLRTPSVNRQDNEKHVVEVIIDEAKRLDLPFQLFEKVQDRPNVFIGNNFNKPTGLLLIAHTDTVSIGDKNKWEFDPFSGRQTNDRIYGRGAIDCKGGIAISLYVMKILKDLGREDLVKCLFSADEESGADSEFGINYVLDQGLAAQNAVYTYGNQTKSKSLNIGHRGLIRVWIICNGESAHSGTLEWQEGLKGSNAIDGIVQFLQEIRTVKLEDSNKLFPDYKSIITPTLLTAGIGESIVPDSARVLLDIRTLPKNSSESIVNTIKEITDSLTKGKRSYTVEIKNNIPAALSNPDSKVVKKAAELMKEIYKINPTIKGSGPANESYMLIRKGIPTIAGFGPMGDGFHSENEYAEIESIKKSLEILTRLAIKL